jgi:hypothetical protein
MHLVDILSEIRHHKRVSSAIFYLCRTSKVAKHMDTKNKMVAVRDSGEEEWRIVG